MALDERRLIRDAMDRLLTGQPIRSTGALTVVALAEEAGVKRHLLTHRHPDLRNEFYVKVKAQGTIPQNEVNLRAKIDKLEARVESLRAELNTLRTEAVLLRRMNNVLTVENRPPAEGRRRNGSLEVVAGLGNHAGGGQTS